MKRQAETSQYIQIYEQIREDIIQGIYAYGSKLPSKRLIAEESGVSVITAEHAYALLLEEGYIEARERSGYFVTFREEELAGAVRVGSVFLLPVHDPQLIRRGKKFRRDIAVSDHIAHHTDLFPCKVDVVEAF